MGYYARRFWPLLIACIFYGAGTGAAFYWFEDSTARQTSVVALTGLVVIWYTWETMQLRRASFAQRELQLRPFVVVEPHERGFRLRNLGHGTALNIKLEDVTISEHEQIVVRFPKLIPVLPAGANAELPAESFKRGRSAGDFFLAHLDPEYARLDLRVRVHFCNTEMKPYVVGESIYPGELRITEVSTRDAL